MSIDNPLKRDPTKVIKKISAGANYGSSAENFVGGKDDLWFDDNGNYSILRRGDGVTPGGHVVGGSGSGTQGPQGDTGATGPQGATGTQGPQGDTGATGPQGPAGADGAVGAQGPAGADGAVGAQGPAGADGAVGAQGPAGADGADGADGATQDLSNYATLTKLAEEVKKMSKPTSYIKATKLELGTSNTWAVSHTLSSDCEVLELRHYNGNDRSVTFDWNNVIAINAGGDKQIYWYEDGAGQETDAGNSIWIKNESTADQIHFALNDPHYPNSQGSISAGTFLVVEWKY